MGRKRWGAAPSKAFCWTCKRIEVKAKILVYQVKAFEKIHFRPMYAGANMGHPSRTLGLGQERKSAGMAEKGNLRH
jgi:hypothetical protein